MDCKKSFWLSTFGYIKSLGIDNVLIIIILIYRKSFTDVLKSITFDKESRKIDKPNKGKAITEEEFDKILSGTSFDRKLDFEQKSKR